MTGAAGKFVELFRALRKTDDVPERLELQGLATRGDDGGLVLREDVRDMVERLEERLRASLDAGKSPREAAEVAKLDVDHRRVTHVVYALFPTEDDDKLYIGETMQTAADRFARHPYGSPELSAAMENMGGKGAWTCAVLIVLPEDARSKELLLYIEARVQRILDTVDGPHGLNFHYGAGVYGGAPDEDRWIAKYTELIEFVVKNGRTPSTTAIGVDENTLGRWVNTQRRMRDGMTTHRRLALESIGNAWRWRVNAPLVTNDDLFEKLRADERVTSSGGMDIPTDIVGAQRLNSARRRYNNGETSEFDRAIILMDFPGLSITKHDASFYLNAKALSEAHPGADTAPSKMTERDLYFWYKNVQNGAVHMTPWREKVIGDLGISKLMDTLKPIEFREKVAEKSIDRAARRYTADASTRYDAREVKKRRMIDDILPRWKD